MITTLEKGEPLFMGEVVALVREEGVTRIYRRDGSTDTIGFTPKTVAKRDETLRDFHTESLIGSSS